MASLCMINAIVSNQSSMCDIIMLQIMTSTADMVITARTMIIISTHNNNSQHTILAADQFKHCVSSSYIQVQH